MTGDALAGSAARAARFDVALAALNRNQVERATDLAEQALAEDDAHPLYLNLAAFRREQSGDLGGALALLERALALAPRDILVLTAVGRTLSQLGRDREAIDYFDAVLVLHPRHAPAHHGRGLSLASVGREEDARKAHMAAADLDPDFPDPLGALADYAMREERFDLARTLAGRALTLDPVQPAAVLAMAALDLQDKKLDQALDRVEALLRTSLAPLHRAAAEQMVGEIEEARGRFKPALDAYTRGNRLVRDIHAPIYGREGAETAVPMTDRLNAFFATQTPAGWEGAPGGAAPAADVHVFLVGFVRSGTTLLEQVLASHPRVIALEEKATLRAITGPYFANSEGLSRMKNLSGEEADGLRSDYWTRVGEFGVEPAGKVFVDKAPLSTLWLPMVAKLFPQAKVIFAVRDPRDVVLSAFKHRFLINPLAWPFTDLVETARFYDGLMALSVRYRELLPLSLYQHRHEDLVQDFDGEVGRICDFLGIAWTDSMRDFAETAKRRDVRTPSRDQVRRGLYSEGMGRWRRYGASVEPVLPILQPWVERYGYES